ncbi:MAG: ABC transporter ATP-binding protein [Desulfovibrio sp.]|uniref:ABC transporter ATP-binding protein n=1 Tax=Desulfovibrio sp. TaxID=885 RepID=UPI00135EB8C1|nr:ABC transporter ATP-binding protein [Desulfovibrio sp.]MTJ93820.1 ABC transporter ATP-binding protein [Desulfovibrio sp.]
MSNNSVVVVEGLGKRYYTPQRSLAGKKSIRAHLKNMGIIRSDAEEDYFWALKDVSFEVPQGQILGIMGKNGSGKSTLLKILTGVTPPTTGRAVLRGRVGSLLEVGTGFHPDMSGRDNVFMNGVLLGIPKAEIKAHFDEIVDFSGIEEFIDVPVKRYSSGMYVRLAYAVASMLRCDVLILDEVLAVGDAAFQNKARKNMQQLVNDGRTILFVSHNVRAVSQLCTSGLMLQQGKLTHIGEILPVMQEYLKIIQHMNELPTELSSEADLRTTTRWEHASKNILTRVQLLNAHGDPSTTFEIGKPFRVRIDYEGCNTSFPIFELFIINEWGERATTINSTHNSDLSAISQSGTVECYVEDLRLGEGKYSLGLDFGHCAGSLQTYCSIDCVVALNFYVQKSDFIGGIGINSTQGAVHKSRWQQV